MKMPFTAKQLIPSVTLSVAMTVPAVAGQQAQGNRPFDLNETTISLIRDAVSKKVVTCEAIVDAYIDRIKRFDKAGSLPINSIIAINPEAVEEARALDQLPSKTLGPAACAPLIIKDNIDVANMATTAGSITMAKNVVRTDATWVARLKAAGAIVVAKSNLAEFAWTPDYSESSLGGLTRNPYDMTRTTGGSSGGTAAAVAANFGVAGLGTDTGASVRGPSAFQNLVGLRPTLGASSRAGVVPIWVTRDTVGPMTRTVTDTAILYSLAFGYDQRDSATQAARGEPPFNLASALTTGGLKGTRVGVMKQMSDPAAFDPDVLSRFNEALNDLRARGAILVDVDVPNFEKLWNFSWPNRMAYDVNAYLQAEGTSRPVSNFNNLVEHIEASDKFDPALQAWIKPQLDALDPGLDQKEVIDEERTTALRKAIITAMNRDAVSVVVYPTWKRAPRRLDRLADDGGNNNSQFAQAGLPAITVPMGDTPNGLPTALQIAGRPFSEEVLVNIAFDYEQATHHRTAPSTLPPASIDR